MGRVNFSIAGGGGRGNAAEVHGYDERGDCWEDHDAERRVLGSLLIIASLVGLVVALIVIFHEADCIGIGTLGGSQQAVCRPTGTRPRVVVRSEEGSGAVSYLLREMPTSFHFVQRSRNISARVEEGAHHSLSVIATEGTTVGFTHVSDCAGAVVRVYDSGNYSVFVEKGAGEATAIEACRPECTFTADRNMEVFLVSDGSACPGSVVSWSVIVNTLRWNISSGSTGSSSSSSYNNVIRRCTATHCEFSAQDSKMVVITELPLEVGPTKLTMHLGYSLFASIGLPILAIAVAFSLILVGFVVIKFTPKVRPPVHAVGPCPSASAMQLESGSSHPPLGLVRPKPVYLHHNFTCRNHRHQRRGR